MPDVQGVLVHLLYRGLAEYDWGSDMLDDYGNSGKADQVLSIDVDLKKKWVDKSFLHSEVLRLLDPQELQNDMQRSFEAMRGSADKKAGK